MDIFALLFNFRLLATSTSWGNQCDYWLSNSWLTAILSKLVMWELTHVKVILTRLLSETWCKFWLIFLFLKLFFCCHLFFILLSELHYQTLLLLYFFIIFFKHKFCFVEVKVHSFVFNFKDLNLPFGFIKFLLEVFYLFLLFD